MECVTCSDMLSDERASLGFDYCMKSDCQRKNRKGVQVIAVGVNKAAAAFYVGDVSDRAARGELSKKNTSLGSVSLRPSSANPRDRSIQSTRRTVRGTQTRTQRPWTSAQEQYVRARIATGATPRQIVADAPQMRLTIRMVSDIMATRPVRRGRFG